MKRSDADPPITQTIEGSSLSASKPVLPTTEEEYDLVTLETAVERYGERLEGKCSLNDIVVTPPIGDDLAGNPMTHVQIRIRRENLPRERGS